MDIQFVVPGQPIGYYASGPRPNWTRREQYHAYKKSVQRFAKKAGLKLPLVATELAPLYIFVICAFSDRRHSDPANVEKGVVDALFYISGSVKKYRCSDKFTGNCSLPPFYNIDNPRIMVRVSDQNFFVFKPVKACSNGVA